MFDHSTRRDFLNQLSWISAVALSAGQFNAFGLHAQKNSQVPLSDVNTTDIASAIALGCGTMSHIFNADDNNLPFFGTTIGPQSDFWFNDAHTEAHVPGRHLNALLNAEDTLGLKIDESAVEKHAAAAFFSYGGKIPLPLNRKHMGGERLNFLPHNIREGFLALYALVKFRKSKKAQILAEQSIDFIFANWSADKGWNRELIEQMGLSLIEWPGPFITGIARAIGPLVKYYRATGYGKALELALILKEKAITEFFQPNGAFDNNKFGNHTHSTTCVMSSLAQLADATSDIHLLERVKSFFDNGLKEISNEIGWSVENCGTNSDPDRGEINNTGDILETALILGKWGYTEYYNYAERTLRSHLLPAQLRDVSFIKEPENPKNEDSKRNVAKRHKGAFGFPAPYGHRPLGNKLISFNLDIVGGGVASLCEAYRSIYTFSGLAHRLNLLFDLEHKDISIRSPYTHEQFVIILKKQAPLLVRIPDFADRAQLKISGTEDWQWNNDYLFFATPPLGRPIVIGFELKVRDITLSYGNRKIRARLKGDAVQAMENFGADLTFFEPV